VVAGEDELKAHGETYLPKPSGMDTDDYNNDKVRAQFLSNPPFRFRKVIQPGAVEFKRTKWRD